MDVPSPAGIHAPDLKKGVYRHYKGDLMEVIGVAMHSETLEPFVVYRHVSGEREDEPYFWIRPYAMFTGNVEVNGESTPRFTYQSSAP